MTTDEMQKVFVGQQALAISAQAANILAPRNVLYGEWLKLLQPGTLVRMREDRGIVVIRIEEWRYEFTTGRPLIGYSYKGFLGRRKFRMQEIDTLAYRLLLAEPPPWSRPL